MMKTNPFDVLPIDKANTHRLVCLLLDCFPAALPHLICALDPLGQPIKNATYAKQAHIRATLRQSNIALKKAYECGIQCCNKEGYTELASKLTARMPLFEGKV